MGKDLNNAKAVVSSRAINLFSYLRDFVSLRGEPILSFEQYEKVIWLEDIPRGTHCTSLYKAGLDQTAPDCWIELSRPDFKDVPRAPSKLAPWLHPEDLQNSNLNELRLLERIPAFSKNGSKLKKGAAPLYLQLKDFFHMLKPLLQEYLENKWRIWAIEDRKLRRVSSIYSHFFSLYQLQQTSGETFDIVLAPGLLVWKPTEDREIKRHIIAARANIIFDERSGKLRLCPAAEGMQAAFETDMLQSDRRPSSRIQTKLDKQLSALGDGIRDAGMIGKILAEWTRALHPDAHYFDSLSKETAADYRPRVFFSPAVIMRRRSSQATLRVLDEILRQLKNKGAIPAGVHSLVTTQDPTSTLIDTDEIKSDFSDNIYYPLPANTDQKKVAHLLDRQQAVVVQGPPGTGKSQTIANLLCHLLTTGNRVLVTSQTPRALKLLKDNIPATLSALCVQSLGNDLSALQDLDHAIRGIIEKQAGWDGNAMAARIKTLEQQLSWSREKQESLGRRIRFLRENDTCRYENMFGNYAGTLQDIARRIKRESKDLSWLPDSIKEDQEAPLSNEEIVEYYKHACSLEPGYDELIDFDATLFSDFLEPKQFNSISEDEFRSRKKFEQYNIDKKDPRFKMFFAMKPAPRAELQEQLTNVLAIYGKVQRSSINWLTEVVEDIATGKAEPWVTLYQNSRYQLQATRKLKGAIQNIVVEGLEENTLQKVKNDIKQLLAHIGKPGKLGFGPFRPKIIKECRYLLSGKILVNGEPCNTARQLYFLLDFIKLGEILKWFSREWAHLHTPDSEATQTFQLAEYTELLDGLKTALEMEKALKKAKAVCERMLQIPEQQWHSKMALSELSILIEAAISAREYQQAQRPIKSLAARLKKQVNGNGDHSKLGKSFLQAVVKRDRALYAESFHLMEKVHKLKDTILRRNHLRSKLLPIAPVFADFLESNLNDDDVFRPLDMFVQAWNWKRAHVWLIRMTNDEERNRLDADMKSITESIKEMQAELIALKAWHISLQRLSRYERQLLTSWKESKEKAEGEGDKYAYIRQRDAREHLERCKSAVPAWIMPFHRIMETMPPQPDSFDVIIVDEAGLSGPEMLIMQYYGKKMVVIGDNQQISAEFDGTNPERVARLRRRYLEGIPHSDHLGSGNSFFEHAATRYSNIIQFKEHFRCMPEIIQFSNSCWYQSKPLIPLRKSASSRLEPILVRHVVTGDFQEMQSRDINSAEAQAIVTQIISCCNDVAYKDKTMGVISLQGSAQARYIEELLLKELGSVKIEERRITCGDARAFQGDERDIIFLSMVVDGKSRIPPATDLKSRRRYNVATSRAKDQMWLFHSVTLQDLNLECIRHKLLEYCQKSERTKVALIEVDRDELQNQASRSDRKKNQVPRPFDNWFEVDVFLKISEKGFRVIPKFRVADYRIDIVVEGKQGKMLAIECEGDQWHGPEKYERDMAREKILVRSGWQFWRVRGGQYYRNPDEALTTLWSTLEASGIKPMTVEHHVEKSSLSTRLEHSPPLQNT